MFKRGIGNNQEDGFTLVELLVVILIMGILSAIAVPVFINVKKGAVDTSVQMDLRQAVTVIDTWQVDHPLGSVTNEALNKLHVSNGNTVTIVSVTPREGYTLCGKNPNGKISSIGYTYHSSGAGLKEEAC